MAVSTTLHRDATQPHGQTQGLVQYAYHDQHLVGRWKLWLQQRGLQMQRRWFNIQCRASTKLEEPMAVVCLVFFLIDVSEGG